LVLSTLSGQAGISVVGETENEKDVPSLVTATKPDLFLDRAGRTAATASVVRLAAEGISCVADYCAGAEQECRDFLLGFVRYPFEDDGGERGGVARGHAGKYVPDEGRHVLKPTLILCCAAIFVNCGKASAQQQRQEKRSE
jgi:hypothetical protein